MDEYSKRRRAERIAASPFKVGVEVALVWSHWTRRITGKRKVVKVYANGNFTITDREGKPGKDQWKPYGSRTAHKAGERGFRSSEHLEIWSPDIEAEIKDRKTIARNEGRRKAIMERLGSMHESELVKASGLLTDLERILGFNEPKAKE